MGAKTEEPIERSAPGFALRGRFARIATVRGLVEELAPALVG